MTRGDIDRAVLEVYVRVLVGCLEVNATEEVALKKAQRAATLAQQDLEGMHAAKSKKKRVEAITPSEGARALLEKYKAILHSLPQPDEPVQPAVWAMLNQAAKREPLDQWVRRFHIVRRSPFCMGKETHFCASLPWLLKTTVAADLDAGKYGQMK